MDGKLGSEVHCVRIEEVGQSGQVGFESSDRFSQSYTSGEGLPESCCWATEGSVTEGAESRGWDGEDCMCHLHSSESESGDDRRLSWRVPGRWWREVDPRLTHEGHPMWHQDVCVLSWTNCWQWSQFIHPSLRLSIHPSKYSLLIPSFLILLESGSAGAPHPPNELLPYRLVTSHQGPHRKTKNCLLFLSHTHLCQLSVFQIWKF